ncbi:hypothetical protein [Paenibacillus polymyxa]|uniref:hypothetical protein n=1 Tax=Paenibacillus polymyxa TaxID=1406 RepID=UPI00215D27BF|nr:hypothetical protein [Paenibacillus polymyxa]
MSWAGSCQATWYHLLCTVEQMPLSPNGKIDRKALPAPEGSLQTGADYAEPRTAQERALVAVWQSVLGLQTVGIWTISLIWAAIRSKPSKSHPVRSRPAISWT